MWFCWALVTHLILPYTLHIFCLACFLVLWCSSFWSAVGPFPNYQFNKNPPYKKSHEAQMWSFSKTYQLYELILLKKNKNSKVKDYISFLNNPSNGLTCKERPF